MIDKNNKNIDIDDKLLSSSIKKHSDKSISMHMPGHKGSADFDFLNSIFDTSLDITEINGFDNLHNPQAILKQSMDSASKIFGVKKSFYLVNGSTCGILASIKAMSNEGDNILVARNCHKAVYNAIDLCRLNPFYIYPNYDEKLGMFGSINPLEIETILKNQKMSLLVLTSPTYEGVISDIKSITEIAHRYGVKVLVDEAHGAHLGFSKYFPQSARNCGADVVIESLHKTLPCPTQTAILHICNDQIDEKEIARCLSIFETSSPSYLFLSAVDGLVKFINKNSHKFNEWHKNIEKFKIKTKNLENIEIFDKNYVLSDSLFDYDKSKIVVLSNCNGINGFMIADILRIDYDIEIEMSSANYVICMTGMSDNENLNILADALIEIDDKLKKTNIDRTKIYRDKIEILKPCKSVNAWQVKNGEFLQLEKCSGKISCEYVWAYPPAVPILVAGEVIDKKFINKIQNLQKLNVNIESTYNKFGYLKVY